MDTNNLQQINNFADGMNTDTSDAVLSESSYRLANNLRFVTNTDENSGELHMIEGAKQRNPEFSENGEIIIGATSLRDKPIYVTQSSQGSYWRVYYDTNTAAKITAEDDRVIGCGHKLSLVTRYETDEILKLYIADGKGPVIIINLTPKGNIPRKLNEVVSYPAVTFKKPIFCGLIDGNIKAAVVEYSYQFYKKYGQQSEISPSTKLIPLFKGATTAKESKRILGYLPDEQSDKGVKIKIKWTADQIKPFDRIKIFRISYIETGQLPQIECVYDEDISGEELIFEDSGQTALQVLSLEEYNSMTGIHIIPKTIESKDDYLFAANVKDDTHGFDIGDWSPQGNVELTLVTVDLVGDNSASPMYVVQKPQKPKYLHGTEQKLLESRIQVAEQNQFSEFELQDYIDTYYVDDNGETKDGKDVLSYHNPQASYMFRSLRRGETYRFGIIFYDKKGRSSGVVHLEDVTIDQDDFFEVDDGQLIVKPKGIKFEVTGSLPAGTVSYEIVRCGRSISDISTITQGFLSRPIAREYTVTGVKENYPLTPTGLVTIHNILWNSDGGEYENATNKTFSASNGKTYSGNNDIFQFVSPELCYTKDSIKGNLGDYELTINPIKYVCPQVFSTDTLPSDSFSTIEIRDTVSAGVAGNITVTVDNTGQVVRYGNAYANVTRYDPEGSLIHVNGWSTLISDYATLQEVLSLNLVGSTDFRDRWYDIDKRFAYSKLYYEYSGKTEENERIESEKTKSYNVSSIAFPETLGWNDFATSAAEASKAELIYNSKVTNIGGRNFVNWVCGGLYGRIFLGAEPYIHIDQLEDGSYTKIGTMGPGGNCMLVRIEDPENTLVNSVPGNSTISTYICNLKKKFVLPEDDISKKNATYRSFGDYFDANQTKAYIFDGDCFIQPFEYIAQHKFAHSSSKYWRTACKIFVVPLETSINLTYTSGYEFNKEFDTSSGDITYIQNDASNVNNIFIQDKPLYVYNTAYSTTDTSRTYVSEMVDDDDDVDTLDYRVFHSNVKTNNEYIDSWLKYMPANFLDVDTRKGPITCLRTFKNQLVFWQEYAAGVLSVNERSMISDDSNMPLILGSGGVLARFDYFTNVNGMHKDDYSDAQSNTTLYWWDRINKSLVGYSGGLDAIELSKIKFVQNYLNKNEEEDHPLVAYDNKTKEVVAKVVKGSGHEEGSLVYNEHLGHFTSLYTIKPEYKIELPEGLLFTTDTHVYDWNMLNNGSAYGLYGDRLCPYLKHVVNHAGQYTKVFDNAEFAGRIYGGEKADYAKWLNLMFSTPLKQNGHITGKDIENREYNFRYVIPRAEDANGNAGEYGDRLRGKTMQCELESTNNSYDFSLQFIKTKFRISWS